MSQPTKTSVATAKSFLKIAKNIGLTAIWFFIGLAALDFSYAVKVVRGQISTSVDVENTAQGLRYTSMGWQDPAAWMPQAQQGGSISLSHVSPLIWTAMLVLAVGIAVMFLSSDDEVDRLFKEQVEKADLMDQWESKDKA